jgi:hypothetical protein
MSGPHASVPEIEVGHLEIQDYWTRRLWPETIPAKHWEDIMPSFKAAAHIRHQGQDMIIFPLSSNFGSQPVAAQEEELAALEYQAHAAGLAGHAVAVWDAGGGRTGFMGPDQWHGFLRGLNLRAALAMVNKLISL